MKKLIDYKPLKKLSINGIDDIECTGLIVIVGPNSSGKSQLLQDIYQKLCGIPRQPVVLKKIEIDKPSDLDAFLNCLKNEGYIDIKVDNGSLTVKTKPVNTPTAQYNAINKIDIVNWYQNFDSETVNATLNSFLNIFGRLIIPELNFGNRKTSLAITNNIDYLTQMPQSDLHSLYVNDYAKEKLCNEIVSTFGQAVWPDATRALQISLKISKDGNLPSAEDRLSFQKMSGFRDLDTEGDGIRSYIFTCVQLLLASRPVFIVDEPELFLHPPQAYNLGKFFGQYGANPDTLTLIATHSSHFLRGVIQAGEKVQIIRMTKNNDEFSGHLVSSEKLKNSLQRPTLRAESILDGIFSQAFVMVEGDGDRLVYQTTWEKIQNEFRFDIHFSQVNGTGGIEHTCRLYKALNIPVAVIADLDIIIDGNRMKNILDVFIEDPGARTTLLSEITELTEFINNAPPFKTPDQVKTEINAMNWGIENRVALSKQISDLSKCLDPLKKIKKGGIDQYPEPIKKQLSSLIDRLKDYGLFLVPVGELEYWVSISEIPTPKSKKSQWAHDAAIHIQAKGNSNDPIWGFIKKLGRYLEKQLSLAT